MAVSRMRRIIGRIWKRVIAVPEALDEGPATAVGLQQRQWIERSRDDALDMAIAVEKGRPRGTGI